MLLFIFLISILGVSSDCTQEQIRKHYKKIAVLVHPDKNKQPGAEEAFKILQRAFELIGEPVNIYYNIRCIFMLWFLTNENLKLNRKIENRMIKVWLKH